MSRPTFTRPKTYHACYMKSILFCLIVISTSTVLAQTSDSTLIDQKTVYDVVDVPAEPVGGITGLYHTILTNIRYPADARQKGITGKVFVEFVIEADGTILKENVRITKPLHKSIDKEGMRVILLSSPWTPAKKGDMNVRSRRTLPITFNL